MAAVGERRGSYVHGHPDLMLLGNTFTILLLLKLSEQKEKSQRMPPGLGPEVQAVTLEFSLANVLLHSATQVLVS